MESCPSLPSFLPRILQNLWNSSHMGYALVQNGLSLTGAGFSTYQPKDGDQTR